jgi:MraZ protein
MARFTATHVNKVDRKGRVSVPSPFRAALDGAAGPVLFIKPDEEVPAFECYDEAYVEEIQARIDELDIGSDERLELETVHFSALIQVTFDTEGRIMLPRQHMEAFGITEQAAFVGLGRHFQIWDPAKWQQRLEKARAAQRERRLRLPKPGSGRA